VRGASNRRLRTRRWFHAYQGEHIAIRPDHCLNPITATIDDHIAHAARPGTGGRQPGSPQIRNGFYLASHRVRGRCASSTSRAPRVCRTMFMLHDGNAVQRRRSAIAGMSAGTRPDAAVINEFGSVGCAIRRWLSAHRTAPVLWNASGAARNVCKAAAWQRPSRAFRAWPGSLMLSESKS